MGRGREDIDELFEGLAKTGLGGERSGARAWSITRLIRPLPLYELEASGEVRRIESAEERDPQGAAEWSLLSQKVRTIVQTVIGYSEIIREDLAGGDLSSPIDDLDRIRSASQELLELARRIEEQLAAEREKRACAESLANLSRRVDGLTSRDEIGRALIEALGPLLGLKGARVLWSEERARDSDAELIALVSRMHAPAARHDASRATLGVPITVSAGVEGVALLERDQGDAFTPAHAGVAAAFASVIERALANLSELDMIKQMAMYDELTGLLNRRQFFARASEQRGQRGALMIDVDRFKMINDTYGHPIGDVVLRGVARRLQEQLRGGDLLGRYGGEEFAVLLSGPDLATTLDVAERLREAIARRPFERPDGDPIAVTISVGAAAGDGSLPFKELLTSADRGLYDAKRAGRDRVATEP